MLSSAESTNLNFKVLVTAICRPGLTSNYALNTWDVNLTPLDGLSGIRPKYTHSDDTKIVLKHTPEAILC